MKTFVHPSRDSHPYAGAPNGGVQLLPIRLPQVNLPSATGAESGGLLFLGKVLRRRKLAIFGIALICGCVAFLLSARQTPVYQARTSLEVQALSEKFLNMRDLEPVAAGGYSESYVETQLQLLQEQALIERVVRKLNLDERPEFLGTPKASRWRKWLGLPWGLASPQERAADMVSRNLKVRGGQSSIVEILFDSPDPQLASAVANGLANEFIEQNLEVRWRAAERSVEWLTPELRELESKLKRSEQQLQAYARDANLIFTSEKVSVEEEKLRQLQQELSKAQAERAAKQTVYERTLLIPPEYLPEVLDSPPLRESQAKLMELRRQLAELNSVFTPAHYKVKHLEAQIAEMEFSINKLQTAILNRIRSEYESAKRLENLTSAAYTREGKLVSDQSAKTIQYNILKREVDANRTLYETLLQKTKEAHIASAIRASNIRIINPAKPPSRPYKPNPALNASLALIAGLFLGVVFAVVRESTDGSLKSPGEITAFLNLPEFAAIPSISSDTLSLALPAQRRDLLLGAGSTPGNSGVRRLRLLGKSHEQTSTELALLAESFRNAVTCLWLQGQNGTGRRLFVLTSPGAQEGKTTVVSHLGIALANSNRRVLLVDGDLRNPRLHQAFGLPNGRGLGNVLEEVGPDPLEALRGLKTGVPNLCVLPAGSGETNIASLRYQDRLMQVLTHFRSQFDVVVVDTPPVLTFPDARILGHLSDGVVMVVRAGETNRTAVAIALLRFQDDGIPVLGTILNDWNPKLFGYGDSIYQNQAFYQHCWETRAVSMNSDLEGFRERLNALEARMAKGGESTESR